jgi:hypothetical protein
MSSLKSALRGNISVGEGESNHGLDYRGSASVTLPGCQRELFGGEPMN